MSEDITKDMDPFLLILSRLDKFEQTLGGLQETVGGLQETVGGLQEAVKSLEKRMDSLEQKVDAKLMDTRPIWERALAEIAETRSELADFKASVERRLEKLDKLDKLESEFVEFKASVERRLEKLDKLDKVEKEVSEFRRETDVNLHKIDRQIGVVAKEFVRVRSDQNYLEDRVEAIEEMLKPKA